MKRLLAGISQARGASDGSRLPQALQSIPAVTPHGIPSAGVAVADQTVAKSLDPFKSSRERFRRRDGHGA